MENMSFDMVTRHFGDLVIFDPALALGNKLTEFISKNGNKYELLDMMKVLKYI